MDQRQLPEDFKDFINFLNDNDVCYLLVGGWAVGIYGYPRATKDIDFLIANGQSTCHLTGITCKSHSSSSFSTS